MGDFSPAGVGLVTEAGADTSDSRGTTIVGGGTADTKGGYTQIDASTAEAVNGFIVTFKSLSSGGTGNYLVDIALGSATEEIIVENLFVFNSQATTEGGVSYYIDVAIPAGERVAARLQSSNGASADDVDIYITYLTKTLAGNSAGSFCESIGENTADSGGTSIDPGATPNTKGSPVQLTASTANAYRGLFVAFGNQGNTGMQTAHFLFDIMIGASTEEVIVANIPVHTSLRETIVYPGTYYNVAVPKGERLTVKCQSSITDATDRLLDVIVYGVM